VKKSKYKSCPAQSRVFEVNIWKTAKERDAAVFNNFEMENSKRKIGCRRNYKILFFEISP